jgi:para-nitrobenzyl esterase
MRAETAMGDLEVRTHDGPLRGFKLKAGGRAFAGIPFARPPIGELRFRPPVPPAPWRGVRDAARWPSAPAQPNGPFLGIAMPLLETSEDCLYLNVWTPSQAIAAPVMVWLFGGGFEMGSASPPHSDCTALMQRGNVMVSVNYRLGALGFLHLGDLDPDSDGRRTNLGLQDQLAALRWVQENIAVFGGDPDNVTVIGESAGAFSIGSLLGIPDADRLFRRAILHSGANRRIISAAVANSMAADLLGHLAVPPNDLTLLSATPVQDVLTAQRDVTDRSLATRNAPGGRIWGPVIDGIVVPSDPMQRVIKGERSSLDLLLTTMRDEAQIWEAMDPTGFEPADLEALVGEMRAWVDADCAAYLVDAYRQHDPLAPLARIRSRFLTDAIYRIPAVEMAEAHVARGSRVWMGIFTFARDAQRGAHHGLDLAFLFDDLATGGPFAEGLPPSTLANRLRDEVLERWTQFARSGAPGWPAYEPEGQRLTWLLGPEHIAAPDPGAEVRQIWKSRWRPPPDSNARSAATVT